MPLFKRHDGDLVRGETPMRRIMPYLMPSRNGSIVLNDSVFQIQDTRIWLKAYNRAHEEHATLFHLLAYAAAQALHERPELNRFVSGGRVYQRRGVQVSFVVKKELKDEGQSTTVKLNVIHGEPFRVFADRLAKAIREAQDTDRAVDRETALIMQLPGFLVRGLVALARGLDRWNLFPRFMTRPDPMFASLFHPNLGSEASATPITISTNTAPSPSSACRRLPHALRGRRRRGDPGQVAGALGTTTHRYRWHPFAEPRAPHRRSHMSTSGAPEGDRPSTRRVPVATANGARCARRPRPPARARSSAARWPPPDAARARSRHPHDRRLGHRGRRRH